DQVADQIAAGEVVERPGSVVKELVENALDAGAHAVRVELEDGGKVLIRVSDDGSVMDREDARLALQRHATSKIRDAVDLIGVGTLGFRGEALPAIASVSRLELETSSDGRAGVRLSLAGPHVAFTFTSDDRALIDVRPTTRPIERVHALWGRELADTLLPIVHREGPLELRGFVQRPAQAKPTGRKGYVFVRGRPIRDPFIVRAAEAGYRSTIAPGDRPSVILFLDLPGDAVDVNVHPAKLEVRFRDKFFVEKVVEEAVRRALGPLAAAAPLGTGGGSIGVGFQVSG